MLAFALQPEQTGEIKLPYSVIHTGGRAQRISLSLHQVAGPSSGATQHPQDTASTPTACTRQQVSWVLEET